MLFPFLALFGHKDMFKICLGIFFENNCLGTFGGILFDV
jgi:hypothetical protein